MRAVETVGGEGFDLLEDRFGERPIEAVLFCPLEKARALALHLRLVLLAHRGAQDVGFLQRIAGQRLRRAHHLLLVDDHAISVAQHRLEQLMIVFDRLLAVLALDERIDHPGIQRARTEERDGRDHVLEIRRLELGQEAAHPRPFHLEHADRVAAREQSVALGIVERKAVQIRRLLAAGRAPG